LLALLVAALAVEITPETEAKAAPPPAPAPVATPAPATVAPPVAAPAPQVVTAPAPTPLPLEVSSGSSRGWLSGAAAFILLVAAGVLVVSRKRRAQPSGEMIRILASKPLGGKTRLVLVGAGPRQLLLSVGDKGARVIGRWAAADGELPPTRALGDTSEGTSGVFGSDGHGLPGPPPPVGAAAASTSPAVAGILRLRQQVPHDDDDLEADAEWARAIIAATTRKGDPS
jgi:flagellar biogenesis protein FliO